MTSKGLRYIQIRENAVREQVVAGLIQPEHQSGDTNIADLFTKEDKLVSIPLRWYRLGWYFEMVRRRLDLVTKFDVIGEQISFHPLIGIVNLAGYDI